MRLMMLYKPGKESDAPPSQQEMAVIDGPFTETKELVAGYGFAPCRSRAFAWSRSRISRPGGLATPAHRAINQLSFFLGCLMNRLILGSPLDRLLKPPAELGLGLGGGDAGEQRQQTGYG